MTYLMLHNPHPVVLTYITIRKTKNGHHNYIFFKNLKKMGNYSISFLPDKITTDDECLADIISGKNFGIDISKFK